MLLQNFRFFMKTTEPQRLPLSRWDSATQGLSSLDFYSCSWRYKTFFGGNLDFPKIKKLNKVCCDDWTCTKMLTQCYFKLNYIRTLFVLKWPILAVSAKGGNLDFLDFLQKKFYNIDYWTRFSFLCARSKRWRITLHSTRVKRLTGRSWNEFYFSTQSWIRVNAFIYSVARFDEISPLCQNFRKYWANYLLFILHLSTS